MNASLSKPRLGLLAGGGRFPFVVAEAARRQGAEVVCVAIQDHADKEIEGAVDRVYWAGLAKMGRVMSVFRREGITRATMAGKIHKVKLFAPFKLWRMLPDLRFLHWWFIRRRKRDNKDDTLLLDVIAEFDREGIQINPAVELCPELLVKSGCRTKRTPTASELADVAFGWEHAREMGRLDIGQAVMVKLKTVLAVEAVEGTDRCILRTGELCPRGGFTVVKVAKPQQDMRFDVPTVGPATIQSMKIAGAGVLAIEAGKTILLDAEETIAAADRAGIAVVALTEAEIESLLRKQAG
jgi:UDP-2,3-diacylglucosamine hydrolase